MKVNIRKGAFETNSSSAHCLVVSSSNKKFTKEDIKWAFNNWNNI